MQDRQFKFCLTNPRADGLILACLFLLVGIALGCQKAPNRDVPANLAARTHNVLKRYISVEDDLFKFTPGRLDPDPRRFESIDFRGHSQTLEQLQQELASIRSQAVTLRGSTEPTLTEFVSALEDYLDSLDLTIKQLQHICGRLLLETEAPGRYAFAEYAEDIGLYTTLRDDYSAKGHRLNSAYERLTNR